MLRCSVCDHSERPAIDRELVADTSSLRKIAERYGLSQTALHRHKNGHISRALRLSRLVQNECEALDCFSVLREAVVTSRLAAAAASRELLDEEGEGFRFNPEAIASLNQSNASIRAAVECIAKVALAVDARGGQSNVPEMDEAAAIISAAFAQHVAPHAVNLVASALEREGGLKPSLAQKLAARAAPMILGKIVELLLDREPPALPLGHVEAAH